MLVVEAKPCFLEFVGVRSDPLIVLIGRVFLGLISRKDQSVLIFERVAGTHLVYLVPFVLHVVFKRISGTLLSAVEIDDAILDEVFVFLG